MKKLILATLMGWAVLTLVASVLVTGTTNTAPTTSMMTYAPPGQCLSEVYQTEAPPPAVRRDQGKDSIRVPMLVGDKINTDYREYR